MLALCILLTMGIFGDIGICEEDKFIVKDLTTSWEPLRYLLEKIDNFYNNPLSE